MLETIDETHLVARLLSRSRCARTIVAVAGPPGVGKSTAVARLARAINQTVGGLAATLPMDGYHFDDWYLEKMGWRARKGAPHTFDVAGLGVMLKRLHADSEDQIAIPLFDRETEISRAGAAMIPRAARIILVEGNYLLLASAPWQGLRRFFDLSVMLLARRETLARRLQHRWQGLGLAPAHIAQKLSENDMPNVETVLSQSAPSDFVIHTDRNA